MRTNIGHLNRTQKCVAACVFAGSCALVFGQSSQLDVNVNDPRPVARAVEQLETKIGVPINYEDPRYENPSDLADVTSAVARSTPSARVIVPRGGPLQTTLQLPATGAASGAADGVSTLTALLGAYRASGSTNEFQSYSANGMLYVVPSRLLSAGGAKISTESVLMTSISIPFQERSAGETLQLILDAVSKATGYTIQLGMAPVGALMSTHVSIGGSPEPARDAMAHLFASLGTPQAPLSYHLYFEPRLRYYMLNMHSVQRPQTASSPAALSSPASVNSHWSKDKH